MKLNNKFIIAALALVPHAMVAYEVTVTNYTPFKLDIAVKYVGESKPLKSCLTDTFSLESQKASAAGYEKTIKTPGICLVSGVEATIASERGIPLTANYYHKIGKMGGSFIVGYNNKAIYVTPLTQDDALGAMHDLSQYYYRQQEAQKQREAEQRTKEQKAKEQREADLRAKEKQKAASKDVSAINTPQEFIAFAETASPREILGVAANADESTINKAFRKLSIKFHPDKWPNDNATATDAYQRIVNARDKLLGKK